MNQTNETNFLLISSVSWHHALVWYAATNILQKHTASIFMVEDTEILKMGSVYGTKTTIPTAIRCRTCKIKLR